MVQLLKARKEKPKYKPMMWSSSDMCSFFFFPPLPHVTVVILVDMLARMMKKSGTPKWTVVAQFMKQLCCHTLLFIRMVFEFKIVAMSRAANCIISEALCRCFVEHHSVRLEFGSLQTANFCS